MVNVNVRVFVSGSGDAVDRVRVAKICIVSVTRTVRVCVGSQVLVWVKVSEPMECVTSSDAVPAHKVTLSLLVVSNVMVSEVDAVSNSLADADCVRTTETDCEGVPFEGVIESVTSSDCEIVPGVIRRVTVLVCGSVNVLVTGGTSDMVFVVVLGSDPEAV